MQLENPTYEFISKVLAQHSLEGGNELNENLLKLFKTFSDNNNKNHVLIKVAALNKIYSTAITNINPVVEQIIKVSERNDELKDIKDFISFVDKISKIEWTNSKGEISKRNNLSFASKYVHFLSGYKTPIYDSYVWIIIKGYLGQKRKVKISFTAPNDYKKFYSTFNEFKREFDLNEYSNYDIDKFLWQYGRNLIKNIELELNINLNKSKTELKKRIKASVFND